MPQEDSQHQTIKLNRGWVFTSAVYKQKYNATVPGSVHTDLFNNHLIPNPLTGKNEKTLQWIDTLDWVYYTEFRKPTSFTNKDQFEIIFKGIDTYADVFLNDSLLFSSGNMFIPWKSRLKYGELRENNILKVVLKSPVKKDSVQYAQLPYELPEGPRVVNRKAAYHYGWDWGPRYVTSGIWQVPEIHIWNTSVIRNVNYTINQLDSSVARLTFQIEIDSKKDYTANLNIYCPIKGVANINKNISLKKGTYTYHINAEIKKPQRWWVHNLGKPFLYPFEFSLFEHKKLLDKTVLKAGLRTVELIREKDESGESFYFKLNGIPVFMKGANYIPQSPFPGTVQDEKYKQLISDAVSANMNMLRVWGGGIYEKDIFYELCDEAGILIWQDFMFANGMFPDDSAFIGNIKKEVSYQVARLKSHPCIALWCGNNEIDEAWHNWGWANVYSKKDSAKIWNNYTNIFHHIIPGIIKNRTPEISYTSSSPLFGRGNPRSSYEGDNHYWYVWHDAYDFDWYNKVTGRFMSEFGFQSFPGMETIEYMAPSSNKEINSEAIQAHQKHHKGQLLINQYMKDYYPVPRKLEDYVYISQLLQAQGIQTGILAQRRAKPFCMGSLYWQLNDCWPAISWSGIDYTGNWKALYYFAKNNFKNTIIAPYLHGDSLNLFVVSDSLASLKATLKWSVMDFSGKKYYADSMQLNIPGNSSSLIYNKQVQNILGQNAADKSLLLLELLHNHKTIDHRIVYFTKPKNLKLGRFNVEHNIKRVEGGYVISLQSNTLIKNLYMHIPAKGWWSENFIDLLPGIEKKVIFKTCEEIKDIQNKIELISLNQIINP